MHNSNTDWVFDDLIEGKNCLRHQNLYKLALMNISNGTNGIPTVFH